MVIRENTYIDEVIGFVEVIDPDHSEQLRITMTHNPDGYFKVVPSSTPSCVAMQVKWCPHSYITV